jgi:hypothetical protein
MLVLLAGDLALFLFGPELMTGGLKDLLSFRVVTDMIEHFRRIAVITKEW